MNKYELRASEEVSENGSIQNAIDAVRAQIANPVNRAHKVFMIKVLAVLETLK